ncbi:L10-interacting MYB domain-containing protein isoform X2 [Pyrus x bretschneideri]|nr:L10-interacting MYB domain-containing protein isoform X2 [Pyrus x bretschneideri]XP_048431564.1 L10-interacting MYB domain-containing protein isoform X2 [Pyrus x bretschneideri]
MANCSARSRGRTLQHQGHQLRAKWTMQLTKILVNLMVDQVHRGNRQNGHMGKKAWKSVCDEFHKRTGLKWDKEQLKNRCTVLRRMYVTVKSLLDRSDFSWDESTGVIAASNAVWAEHIREHPDAETLKTSGCPIFKELCTIFSKPPTNGKHDHPAEHEGGDPNSRPSEPVSLNQEESSSDSQEGDDAVNGQETFQPAIRKRGRKGTDDAIAGAILEMAAASRLRAAATQQRDARYTIASCIEELDKMQGVDEHVYFAALDLFNKPVAREMFLSLKGEKRLIWLRSKCTAAPAL